ncbi:NAD(P)-binding domain-containing protein [Rhodococcus wratislaviensis]|uniref:NAD(P)-binding domain-containing protein n=1 Tax=Rhodococcus wratislaviensis TaxID=44752 RepID=UPI00365241B6
MRTQESKEKFMTTGFTADVAVLGSGLMGSAVAKAMAAAGNRVIVWNRTLAKAEALKGNNIEVAPGAQAAFDAAPVVMTSVGNSDDVRAVFEQATSVAGHTLVNVTSGTSREAHSLAAWAKDNGAAYIDGAILAYPKHLGTDQGLVVFSGDKKAWDGISNLMQGVGNPRFVGENVGAAQTIDNCVAGAFNMAALVAMIESATVATDNGVSADELKYALSHVLGYFPGFVEEVVTNVAGDSHDTDQATLQVYGSAAQVVVKDLQDSGYNARMMNAVADALRVAMEAGLGDDAITAVQRIIRKHA